MFNYTLCVHMFDVKWIIVHLYFLKWMAHCGF